MTVPPETRNPARTADSAGADDIPETSALDEALVGELSGLSAGRSLSYDVAVSQEEREAAHDPNRYPPRSYWRTLLARLEREAGAAASHRRAALLLHEIGRISERALNQPDRAVDYYRAAFERDPRLLVNCRALYRLLMADGEHTEAASALSAEIDGLSDPAERAAALCERGLLRLERLGDIQNARIDFQAALDIDDKDSVATQALFLLSCRTGDLDDAISLLERRLRVVREPAWRSALMGELGRLEILRGPASSGLSATSDSRRSWLSRLAMIFRTAQNADPLNLAATRASLAVARQLNDNPQVIALSRSLAAHEPPRIAAGLLWEAAQIAVEHLRNDELAAECLVLAEQRAPGDLALLSGLFEVYDRLRRWPDAALTIERLLAVLPPGTEHASWLLRLARLRRERLQDDEGAIAALQLAIEHDPANQQARSLLGRTLTRARRFEDLVALLESEQEQKQEPGAKAATAFRIGHVSERELGDSARAIDAYEAALSAVPGYRAAMRGITRVLRESGRLEEVVAIYERDLAFVKDREQRVAMLRRIAELWERDLHDPPAALSALERLAALDPDDSTTLRALYRIYRLGNRWGDLVALMGAEAARCPDSWRKAVLLCEVGDIYEQRLGDPEGALRAYVEASDAAPHYQPGAMNAGRLLVQKGDYQAVASLHRRELASCDEPQHAVWLLQKLGRIASTHLGDEALATDSFRQAIVMCGDGEIPPGTPLAAARASAAQQWIWHLRRRGRLRDGDLVAALHALPTSSQLAVRALRRRWIAEAQNRRGKRDIAADQLRQGLHVCFDDAACQLLARIYRDEGDRRRVLGLFALEAEASGLQEQALDASLKLAFAFATSEHELHHAIHGYETILGRDPRNLVALRQLSHLYAAQQQWRDLVAVIELERERSEDFDYHNAAALVLAPLRELVTMEPAAAAQAAVEVLERQDTNQQALDLLERHARRERSHTMMQQSLSRRIRTAQSAAEQVAELEALAASHCGANDLVAGAGYFRQAAELSMPPSFTAARGWYRAAEALDDFQQMAMALEKQADASVIPSERAQRRYEAGMVWLKLDNPTRASTALRGVLEIEPLHHEAIAQLVSLYTTNEEYRALAALFEHQISHAGTQDERRTLLIRLADLQRGRLQDSAEARSCIVRALELFPDDVQLMTTLADLCRLGEDWTGLVDIDQRLLALGNDPIIQKSLLFELGVVLQDKLGDEESAIGAYRELLDQDPDDLSALLRLSALLVERKHWEEASRITGRLIQRDEDRKRVKEHHLRLATIEAEGFQRLPRAIQSCRRALALDPGDLEAAERMADLLTRAGDFRGLHAHLESTLTVHRGRLERDPFTLESFDALLRVFRRRGAQDHIYVLQSVLAAIQSADAANSAELAAYRDIAPLRAKRPLTDDEAERVLLHPRQRGALELVVRHSDALMNKVFGKDSTPKQKGQAFTPKSHPQIARTIDELKATIGVEKVDLEFADCELDTITVLDTSTPRILLPVDISDEEFPLFRFQIARMLARIRLGYLLPTRLGEALWGRAMVALMRAVCASYRPPIQDPEIDGLELQLQKALSRRARKTLESPCLELGDKPFEPAQWLDWMLQTEDRVALTATADVGTAIQLVMRQDVYALAPAANYLEGLRSASGPRFRQLLSFALSDEHLTSRERLGTALPSS